MVASKLDYILAQGLRDTRGSDVSRESLDEKDDDRRGGLRWYRGVSKLLALQDKEFDHFEYR